MSKIPFIVLMCCVAMMSCNGVGKHSSQVDAPECDTVDSMSVEDTISAIIIEEKPIPASAEELFDDFFFNYASNNVFQKSRTVFPLKVYDGDSVVFVSKSEWTPGRFFADQGFYTLIFDNYAHMDKSKETAVEKVVVEKIMLNEQVVTNYDFSRNNGVWMLRSVSCSRVMDNPNASFLEFYRRFSADSLFQTANLKNPLYFEAPDPDDDFQRIEGLVTMDTWPAFAPDFPAGVIYNIVYSPVDGLSNEKIFVIRGISNGLESEFVFIREHGKWLLSKIIT